MEYDYIITGGGCAGLSLAVRLQQSPTLRNKKVLIVDRERKSRNDRTWCFWERDADLFEPVVHRRWQHLFFHGDGFSKQLDIAPYQYKMIRGIDFYDYCYAQLEESANVSFVYGDLERIVNHPSSASVMVGGQAFHGQYVFNSVLLDKPKLHPKHHYLMQHFKGWFVKTEQPFFNQGQATLMDFRVSQEHGTTFVYVLPFSEHEALIEYTLFTKELLTPDAYQQALKDYTRTWLNLPAFEIQDEEFGIIPMTDYPFESPEGRIIPLGTAGGQTKASSGYTFRYIQKHTAQLVSQLEETGAPFLPARLADRRYGLYDATLLRILAKNELQGSKIFTLLFKNGDPQRVFKFLDNETNFFEEVNIMWRLPQWPFAKAAIREMIK
jgi:lycopene beta-cyclase